jgi:hypothetical protein
LEKETLDLSDIIIHLGPRPFPMADFMQDYLNEIAERKKLEDERKKEDEKKKQTEKKEDKKSDEPTEGKPQGRDEEAIHDADTIIK